MQNNLPRHWFVRGINWGLLGSAGSGLGLLLYGAAQAHKVALQTLELGPLHFLTFTRDTAAQGTTATISFGNGWLILLLFWLGTGLGVAYLRRARPPLHQAATEKTKDET